MSRASFVFSPTALRSLQLDEDMLERYKYKQQLASRQISGYLLKKEARDRVPARGRGSSLPPAVCRDPVVQNALYTGDVESLQRLFPRGSSADLVIEPQGGDMRWVASGEETSGTPPSRLLAMATRWIKPKKKYRSDVILTEKATGCVLRFWNALLAGDELTLLSVADDKDHVDLLNATYDASDIEEWKSLRFNYRGLRLWSLTYEQELTTPLHITAGRGFVDCLKLLLQRGADVDQSPGGTTALHEACVSCQPECCKLLLSHGANANAVNDDGVTPLHECASAESLECAKLLLQYGAAINAASSETNEMPLHVAAKNGLPDHVELYLRYGAALDRKNNAGHTPLNAACAQPQEPRELARYHRACQLLLAAGADVQTGDADKLSPLHMACKAVNPELVELLLEHGAAVNHMCYSGEAPMQKILKEVCYKLDHQPERVVRSLLNHGSIRVWPGALPKVLKHCCGSPRTMEVLLNAYDRLKVTDAWTEAVSPEVYKAHQRFYQSLFSMADAPRSLQHLARWKLRSFLNGRMHKVVPSLNLPTFIKNYLLLDFRDFLH